MNRAAPRQYSRRQWLSGSFADQNEFELRASGPATNKSMPAFVRAVIQGRHCMAYRGLVCTVCVEQCPESGAIERVKGIPQVNPVLCTGCAKCHEVCPAPTNAVLMLNNISR